MRIVALSFLSILLAFAEPSLAVRQGTVTADLFIKRYTQSGDFGRLALWHEAAAECLKRISVPMNQIAHDYYVRHGYKKWAARAKKEGQEIQKQYQSYHTHAKIARQKSAEGICNKEFVGGVYNPDSSPMLDAERQNIEKFIATWLPHYPNRFYEFGIYPTFFRKQRELAEQNGDYARVLQLEADAAAMCAAQYEQIPIAYGLKNYERHRDAYRQHASHLRTLAQQNPKTLPPEADEGRRILDKLTIQTASAQQKADVILHIAKSDERVKAALADQRGVHAYPTFQGFVWTVHFSNHSQGNIAIAIVDEKTARVLDVF